MGIRFGSYLVGTPCEDGSLVEVTSPKGRYLGTGFYNSCSKIRIRVISTNANDRFDRDFFRRRLCHAWEYRKTVMGADINCCRLIFGEATYSRPYGGPVWGRSW